MAKKRTILSLDDLTTRNPAMQRCLALAREAARSDIPILLLGETGTGKTLLAGAIHQSSRRARGEFVSFNASAMSDTLVESQLFGHEKGSFTGATQSRRGKFEIADTGTLFFDEVADMSPVAQAKVLRAVEYGEYERLGSEVMRHADVRIISATNTSLRRLSAEGRFREDLYHRLNGLTLVIPTLRDRPEDLPELLAWELQTSARRADKRITSIHPQAYDKLMAYDWPGNLRELHRVVQTVVLFTQGEEVTPDAVVLMEEDLPVRPMPGQPAPAPAPRAAGAAPPAPPALDGNLTLAAAVRRHIEHVYTLSGNNQRKTARMLGISRSTLDRKLAAFEEGVEALD